jgi:hypothetical protein
MGWGICSWNQEQRDLIPDVLDKSSDCEFQKDTSGLQRSSLHSCVVSRFSIPIMVGNLEIDLDDVHPKDSHAVRKTAFASLSMPRTLRQASTCLVLRSAGRAVRLHD